MSNKTKKNTAKIPKSNSPVCDALCQLFLENPGQDSLEKNEWRALAFNLENQLSLLKEKIRLIQKVSIDVDDVEMIDDEA